MIRRETPGDSPHQGCDVQDGGAIDLYFYAELGPGARADVDRHLAGCASCRQALRELTEIRAALDGRLPVSAPPAGDWSAFTARLNRAIEAEPGPSLPVALPAIRRPAPRRYAAYLAMAALLALVTMSVLYTAKGRSAAPVAGPDLAVSDITPPPASDENGTTALVALSEQHFERSKLVVLGLAAKDPDHTSSADWAYERGLATRLLSDTRLYRMAAEARGLTTVAGVMQDLELVLLQASLSERADAATLEQIQRLIRRRDLLEKMNVVNTRGL